MYAYVYQTVIRSESCSASSAADDRQRVDGLSLWKCQSMMVLVGPSRIEVDACVSLGVNQIARKKEKGEKEKDAGCCSGKLAGVPVDDRERHLYETL